MSKFEPKSTEHCCKNCKWLTSEYGVATFPAQARCKKFEVLVTLDRTTCIEDEENWKPEQFAEKLRDYAQEAIYRGVRGGGGSFLPPEGYINGKEREIRERLGRIEKRLKEQGEKKNGIDKRMDRLEVVVNGYDARIDEYGKCALMSSNDADALNEKIAQLDKKLTSLATIVKQLDERSAGAEKAISKDNGRNYRELSERLEALEKYSDFLEGMSKLYNPKWVLQDVGEISSPLLKKMNEVIDEMVRETKSQVETPKEETCHNESSGVKDFVCSNCHKYIYEYDEKIFNYCPNCGRKIIELPETDYRRYQDKIDVKYDLKEEEEKKCQQ